MENRHVVCPSCGKTNRVPLARLAEGGRCGVCKADLFTGHPIAVDAAGFDRHAAGNDLPVLVDVWAPWCGPCRMMAPNFEQAAGILEPRVRLLKLNADEAPEISQRYGIRSIPTMLLLQGNRVLARTAGAMDTRRIVDWVRDNLAAAA